MNFAQQYAADRADAATDLAATVHSLMNDDGRYGSDWMDWTHDEVRAAVQALPVPFAWDAWIPTAHSAALDVARHYAPAVFENMTHKGFLRAYAVAYKRPAKIEDTLSSDSGLPSLV